MMPPANERKERLVALDSLRGMAAFSVMLYHLVLVFPAVFMVVNSGHPSASWLLNLMTFTPLHVFWCGYESVLFFFVLSGFVLALPFLEATTPGAVSAYFTKRIFRIYPPYIIAVIIAILASAVFYRGAIPQLSTWFNTQWQTGVDWKLVAQHFFLIGSFDFNRFDGPIWSLVMEMRISLLFPLLMWLVRRCDWKTSLLVALLPGLIYWVLTRLKYHQVFDFQHNYFDTLRYIGCFILGGTLAKHRLALVKFFQSFSQPRKAIFLVVSVFAYTNIWWLNDALLSNHHGWQRLTGNIFLQDIGVCLGVAGFIITGLGSRSAGGVLASPPLVFLGRISYSLYLYHVICLFSLLNIFYGRIPTSLILMVTLLLSSTLAIIGYYLVEVPAMNLGRKLAGTFKKR
jgi:peptidoglycan/LPS O-acetylase OafA/YrhL